MRMTCWGHHRVHVYVDYVGHKTERPSSAGNIANVVTSPALLGYDSRLFIFVSARVADALGCYSDAGLELSLIVRVSP